MAIGLGKMFGFEFKKNFDHPYVSKSATEFGEGGIFLLERGLESMYIFLSAAIDVRFREIYLT